MSITPSRFLRGALLADGAASAVTGLLCAAGAGVLAPLLGLPEPLLRIAGLLLLPYAAVVAFLGTRSGLHPALVWTVIVGNVLYAFECFGLIAGSSVAPTGLGIAFLAAQAFAVLVLAQCQFVGLRRPARLPTPA